MTSTDNKLLILVDGSSYLHRAYHALPPLTTTKGEPTGAVYGVISMLQRLMKDYPTAFIGVIFDAKGKNFRHELYPLYKANRPPMPNELIVQTERLNAIIPAMGLPLIRIEGIEADDVIATLTQKALEAHYDVIISTGDKDLAQLVNPHVKLINTMSRTTLDEEGVKKKFGVPVERLIDYFTLMGDASDNIPGVTGVGPKTAAKWITTYGSLKNLLAHRDQISGKIGQNLKEALPQLELTQKLVTVKTDLPLPIQLQDLHKQEPDKTKLIDLFTQLEFKKELKELTSSETSSDQNLPQQGTYHTILKEKDFLVWIEKLKQAPYFALDTETTSLNYMEAQLVGISFALHPAEAIYIPLRHDYLGMPTLLEPAFVFKELRPILENPKIKKIGHNLKYDIEVLANEGITVQGIAYDTLLESFLLDNTALRYDLASLSQKYLQLKKMTYEEFVGKGSHQNLISSMSVETTTLYAATDADLTLRLHQHLWPQLEKIPSVKSLFENIEMPLIPVLVHMERMGVLIDAQELKKQSIHLEEQIQKITQKIFLLTGTTFNLDSPKQLQEILYQKLKLPTSKKTPTGQFSTSESILETLAHNFPIPKLILEYRTLSKLKSTYTDRLVEQIFPKTGRVHTSYNQTVTTTGRLSSSNPNLQNIPIRTEEGRRIRHAFKAPSGYKILSADYSQIELRLVAHFSQDKAMIEDFKNGKDIHAATASKLFGVSLSQVTDDQRRKAKTINFGLMYGMSVFGLAQRLEMERALAKAYIESYFNQYPGIQKFVEHIKTLAQKNGYVETLLGRRIIIPDINSQNKAKQNAAERLAINAPLQGSAADIIKRAMIDIDQWLLEKKVQAHLILQVHDELIFEIAEADLKAASAQIKKIMESAVKLIVPLIVDIGTGSNWDEAH